MSLCPYANVSSMRFITLSKSGTLIHLTAPKRLSGMKLFIAMTPTLAAVVVRMLPGSLAGLYTRLGVS